MPSGSNGTVRIMIILASPVPGAVHLSLPPAVGRAAVLLLNHRPAFFEFGRPDARRAWPSARLSFCCTPLYL